MYKINVGVSVGKRVTFVPPSVSITFVEVNGERVVDGDGREREIVIHPGVGYVIRIGFVGESKKREMKEMNAFTRYVEEKMKGREMGRECEW